MYLDVQIIGGTHRCAPADACIAQANVRTHTQITQRHRDTSVNKMQTTTARKLALLAL